MQFIYGIIYGTSVNRLLRSINKMLSGITNFRLPPAGMVEFKLKNGEYLHFYTNQTDHAGFLAFWEGLYQYEYMDLFSDLIGKCDGFLDIGSNAGLYSLIAAKHSDRVKVIAFDPTPAATEYIEKNIAANNLGSRITFNRMAVSDTEGEVEFFNVHNPKYPKLPNLGGASSFVVKPKTFDAYKVKSVSLDGYLRQHSPDFKVDLVKIDAEGAEPMILEGMKQIIERDKPIIICEILHDEVLSGIEREFGQHGYGYYFHVPNGLKKVAALNQKSDFDDIRNCFFIPKEKISMVKEWIVD